MQVLRVILCHPLESVIIKICDGKTIIVSA